MSRRPPALELDDPLRPAAHEDVTALRGGHAEEGPAALARDGELTAAAEGTQESGAGVEQAPSASGRAEDSAALGAPAAGPAQRPTRRRRPSRAAPRADEGGDSVAAGVPPELPAVSGEGGPWRSWGRSTRTASYRLPDELLTELDDRARDLGLPIGMTVAAGVLQLLDQDDAAVVAAVEHAEDARLQGQREARRHRSARGEVAA